MLGSGILHGAGFMHAALPWWFVSAFVVVMGAIVGQRFANTPARMLFAYLGAAVGSFAVAASVCASFACWLRRVTAAPGRRPGGGLRAGRAGHHDGAGAGAAPRSGLRRRAPAGALLDGVVAAAVLRASVLRAGASRRRSRTKRKIRKIRARRPAELIPPPARACAAAGRAAARHRPAPRPARRSARRRGRATA